MKLALLNETPLAAKPAQLPEMDDLLSFREILAVLQRHKKLILFCIATGLMLGLVYIMFSAPRYTTTASILVDPRQNNSALPQQIAGGVTFQENLIIDSQIEVIKSRRLMDKVAKKAGLYETAVAPVKSPFDSLKEAMFGVEDASKAKAQGERTKQAMLDGFMSGLDVSRVRNTYVIAISYTAPNPQVASDIANLIAETYLDSEMEAQYESSDRANKWLKMRLGVLQNELTTTESEVEDYKAENNIVQTGEKTLLSDQQLSELNSNLIIARAESAQAKARYDNIQNIIKVGNPETATSDVLNNKVIGDLRSKYIDLSRLAKEILRRESSDHQAYRNLLQQMQDIQSLIWSEYRRIAESYKNEYEIARSKELTLQQELDAVKGTSAISGRSQIALRAMQRRADSTRNLYTKMLDKSNEEIEKQTLPSIHARVISYATPPLSSSWPNKQMVLAIALLLGSLVGIGFAFLREQFEKFLWKAEDIESAAQRTCLGMLPKIAFDREKVVHFTKRWSTKDISVSELSNTFNASGFAEITKPLEQQTGIITEIMRNVQLATHFNAEKKEGHEAKVISFVSARPGEGKSITSCFLAKHLAKTGARVALIDCDFRRPSLTHWFLSGGTMGFYELASRLGQEDERMVLMDLAKICHKTGQENLYFIPAKGTTTSISNLNLVASGQMYALINYLKQVFDVILIDLPPIMNIVDARMIANSIDSFILLAHWGKTDRSIVSKALHRAPEVFNKTVGSLLTLVDTEKASKYGYYNYNYYYYYHHQPS
ncbi:MAG: GumC family protein [Rickettsiales bacterium]